MLFRIKIVQTIQYRQKAIHGPMTTGVEDSAGCQGPGLQRQHDQAVGGRELAAGGMDGGEAPSRRRCGGDVVLADELIHPVMETIGHDWEAGVLDVFQEHRGSRIVELALGATPEGNSTRWRACS